MERAPRLPAEGTRRTILDASSTTRSARSSEPGRLVMCRTREPSQRAPFIVADGASARDGQSAEGISDLLCLGSRPAGLAALVRARATKISSVTGSDLGATGVLQSALGNLPELFIRHLRPAGRPGRRRPIGAGVRSGQQAGWFLGLASSARGLRHGPQKFGTDQTKMNGHAARPGGRGDGDNRR